MPKRRLRRIRFCRLWSRTGRRALYLDDQTWDSQKGGRWTGVDKPGKTNSNGKKDNFKMGRRDKKRKSERKNAGSLYTTSKQTMSAGWEVFFV